MGDRGFARREGVRHVLKGGGNVLVRLNLTNLPLLDPDGKSFSLLCHLRALPETKVGDWDVVVSHDSTLMSGRVCALKRSEAAAEKARRKVLREHARKGHKATPETIEAAGYVFVFTTLDRRFDATTILELYRGRWQIELAFKRLKSIIGLGHLKKTDIEAAKAWIHGKLLVAFLIEALIGAGQSFFPWGYPICPPHPAVTMPLEGELINASPV